MDRVARKREKDFGKIEKDKLSKERERKKETGFEVIKRKDKETRKVKKELEKLRENYMERKEKEGKKRSICSQLRKEYKELMERKKEKQYEKWLKEVKED